MLRKSSEGAAVNHCLHEEGGEKRAMMDGSGSAPVRLVRAGSVPGENCFGFFMYLQA